MRRIVAGLAITLDGVVEAPSQSGWMRLLAQGLLTDRYLEEIPEDSRVATGGAMSRDMLSEENLAKVRALNDIAKRQGQTLAQMAVAWTLRDPRVTSTLIGASSVRQLEDNVAALESLEFTSDEIDRHATESDINIWARSSAG